MSKKRINLKSLGLKHGEPVTVRWFDANSQEDEVVRHDEEFERRIETENCGWFVSFNRDYVTIASEKYEDGHYRTLFNIPRVNILSISKLGPVGSVGI